MRPHNCEAPGDVGASHGGEGWNNDQLGPAICSPRSIPDVRLQYLAARLHALGPRSTYELFREIAAGADLFNRLEVYVLLDPARSAPMCFPSTLFLSSAGTLHEHGRTDCKGAQRSPGIRQRLFVSVSGRQPRSSPRGSESVTIGPRRGFPTAFGALLCWMRSAGRA